jgi:hypothetical protein
MQIVRRQTPNRLRIVAAAAVLLFLAGCPRSKPSPADGQFARLGEQKRASIARECRTVTDFVFSPNGRRVCYTGWLDGNDAGRAGLWVGDSLVMRVDSVFELGFTNTNEPWFIGMDSGKAFIYYRYARPRAYERITDVRFSDDGNRFAYLTRNGGRQTLVVDNASTRSVINVLDYSLSPSGDRCAWAVSDSADWSVVDGSDTSDIYDWVQGMTFSANGASLAYAALADDEWFVVHDGEELPGFGEQTIEIREVTLNADGRHLAYVVSELDSEESGSYTFVVKDDEEDANVYLDIAGLCFSPDGRELAYVADDGDGQFTAGFGPEGEMYDAVWGLAFNPAGNRLAAVVRLGDEEMVVVDGRELAPYDQIDKVVFSRNSRRVGYGAVRDQEFLWVVSQVW